MSQLFSGSSVKSTLASDTKVDYLPKFGGRSSASPSVEVEEIVVFPRWLFVSSSIFSTPRSWGEASLGNIQTAAESGRAYTLRGWRLGGSVGIGFGRWGLGWGWVGVGWWVIIPPK